MDLIEKEFRDRAIVRGGLYLFCPKDAVDVVRRCAELGIGIIGIDAFIVNESSIQPLMEHSIDFSAQATCGDKWSAAELFIVSRAEEGLLFEVVYD